jgi:sulfide:quinone oxidoreductase
MSGQRKPESISKELQRIHKRGVEFVNGHINAIDPEKREVQVGDATLSCDHLVVSLGAELAPESVPGLPAFGFNVYTLDGAIGAREALGAFGGGTVGVVIAGTPYKCPAAPYEAAFLAEDLLRRLGVRGRSEVHMFAPEQQPLPVAGPVVGSAVRGLLEQRGIQYHPSFVLKEVNPDAKELSFGNGERVRLDLLLYVPPHRPAAVVAQSPLAGTNKWVSEVDSRTLETPFANVFSIGDVNLIPVASGLPLPKAGVFAHHQAEAVSRTIATRVTAKGVPGEFGGGGS